MKPNARLVIASAGILYGTVTVGGSLLARRDLSALDISFFFLLLSLIPLSVGVFLREKSRKGFGQRVWSSRRYLSIYALVNTFLVVSQFGSLALGLSPAITALLLYTQPVWTIIFGRFFFAERIDSPRIGIIALALAGALLLTDPFSSLGQPQGPQLTAELLALLGGVFLSLWIILGKKGRLEAFKDPLELTLAVRGSTFVPVAAVCFLSTVFLGRSLFAANFDGLWANLPYLFVFSFVAGVLPDSLFYVGIAKVESLQAGVILLLEPISATAISVVLMIAGLAMIQVAGAALILLSNYFALRQSRVQGDNSGEGYTMAAPSSSPNLPHSDRAGGGKRKES